MTHTMFRIRQCFALNARDMVTMRMFVQLKLSQGKKITYKEVAAHFKRAVKEIKLSEWL